MGKVVRRRRAIARHFDAVTDHQESSSWHTSFTCHQAWAKESGCIGLQHDRHPTVANRDDARDSAPRRSRDQAIGYGVGQRAVRWRAHDPDDHCPQRRLSRVRLRYMTGNPFRGITTELMAAGVGVELCGATAKTHGWVNSDAIEGVKVNTEAMARITRVRQCPCRRVCCWTARSTIPTGNWTWLVAAGWCRPSPRQTNKLNADQTAGTCNRQ